MKLPPDSSVRLAVTLLENTACDVERVEDAWSDVAEYLSAEMQRRKDLKAIRTRKGRKWGLDVAS